METLPSEIYLVVDNARSQALTRTWEQLDDPSIAEVDVYFRSSTDVALIAVQIHPDRDRGRWIGLAVGSGMPVIDPSRMGEGDRRAFFAIYLPSYEHVVSTAPGVADAMAVLRAKTVGATGSAPRPLVFAASTRDDTGNQAEPAGDDDCGTGSNPGRRATSPGMGVITRDSALTTRSEKSPLPAAIRRDIRPTPNLMRPARGRMPRETEPLPPSTRAPSPSPSSDTPSLTVRYLRGGHWSPARLRSLSARGAYLVTGAPPRVGDEVHVALDLAEHSVLIRGSVYHATTARDVAVTGSSGFAVRFPADPSPARTRLIELLQLARAEGVVIRPPPVRHAMRFPVRWPVQLKGDQAIDTDALDVSEGGMFVSSGSEPLTGTVTAVIEMDVGDPPIEVKARVARAVSRGDAVARGLSAGYGLEIVEMADGDRVRWNRFLGRIERRTARSVLVAAAPDRLDAIARALTDAGYAVVSSADPGTLVRIADTGQLPDVAVIDDSLLERGVAANLLEQMFTARHVPCVTVHGEPTRARQVVDRVLAVAAS